MTSLELLSALDADADAIAALVERQLLRETRRPRRRFQELRLREAVACLEGDRERAARLARDAGLIEMIERARDRQLSGSDPSAGLVTLNVRWDDVALTLQRRLSERARATTAGACPRCSEPMDERVHRQTKGGTSPVKGSRRAPDDPTVYRGEICRHCGYTSYPTRGRQQW